MPPEAGRRSLGTAPLPSSGVQVFPQGVPVLIPAPRPTDLITDPPVHLSPPSSYCLFPAHLLPLGGCPSPGLAVSSEKRKPYAPLVTGVPGPVPTSRGAALRGGDRGPTDSLLSGDTWVWGAFGSDEPSQQKALSGRLVFSPRGGVTSPTPQSVIPNPAALWAPRPESTPGNHENWSPAPLRNPGEAGRLHFLLPEGSLWNGDQLSQGPGQVFGLWRRKWRRGSECGHEWE